MTQIQPRQVLRQHAAAAFSVDMLTSMLDFLECHHERLLLLILSNDCFWRPRTNYPNELVLHLHRCMAVKLACLLVLCMLITRTMVSTIMVQLRLPYSVLIQDL